MKLMLKLLLVTICCITFADAQQYPKPEQLKKEYESLAELSDRAASQGKLDQYGVMRKMLLERFIEYLPNDIEQYPELSSYAARDIQKIIEDENQRLRDILLDKYEPVKTVKRIPTEKPEISDGHFEQTVEWSDGTIEKDRPVYMFGFGHFHNMRNDIEWLGKLGINYCETEIGPRESLKSETEVNEDMIKYYRSFVNKAYDSGVLVDLLLSPHYTPGWAKEKYPELYPHLGGFLRINMYNPIVNKIVDRHIDKTLGIIGKEPGLWTICASNEPVAFLWSNVPEMKGMWLRYLKDQYGSLDNINKKWQTEYKTWQEIPAYLTPPSRPFPEEPALFDWMRFNDSSFAAWHGSLEEEIDSVLDKNNYEKRPVQIKMIERSFRQYDLMQGGDPYEFGKYFDLNGMDGGSYPFKVDSDEKMALGIRGATLKNILLRSINKLPVVNTENHLLRDRYTNDILPGHIRASMWLQLLTGQHGSVAWAWERRDKEKSNIFKGLFQYRPLQTEEYMRTGFDAMRLMPYITAIADSEPQIGILYSRASLLRNVEAKDELMNCIDAVYELGIPFALIPEQMFENNEIEAKLPEVKTVILAGATHITDKAMTGLDYYLKMGFHANEASAIVIGDNIAKYNEYCQQRRNDIFNDTAVISMFIDEKEAHELKNDLRKTLSSIDIYPEYQLVYADTQEPVEGMFWRTAKLDGKLAASVVNATRETVKCMWIDAEGNKMSFKDESSLSGVKTSTVITIEPLGINCGTISEAKDTKINAKINQEPTFMNNEYLDAIPGKYNPELHLVGLEWHGPGYHSMVPNGTWVHRAITSLNYALYLYKTDIPGNIEEANKIVAKVISLQDTDPMNKTFGIWSWLYEEPLSEMNPPDWNLADFCGKCLCEIYILHNEYLPDELSKEIKTSIYNAAMSIFRRNVGPEYTNIAIQGSGVCICASEILGNEFFYDYGLEKLTAVFERAKGLGAYDEYNSPNYTAFVLTLCEDYKKLFTTPEALDVLENLRVFTWHDIASHYHPGTNQWAGPFARTYSDRMNPSNAAWISKVTGLDIRPHYSFTHTKVAKDAKSNLKCPEEHKSLFKELPSDEVLIKGQSRRARIDGIPVSLTTWMVEDLCFGTCERDNMWTQRRPFLAYWKSDIEPAVYLKARFMKNDYDFASMIIHNAQDRNKALTCFSPVTDRSDKHDTLYRPEDGVFKTTDMRARFEINGRGVKAEKINNSTFRLYDDAYQAVFHVSDSYFAGKKVKWEVGHDENNTAYLDAVCYEGKETGFDFDNLKDTYLVCSVEIIKSDDKPEIKSGPVVENNNGEITAEWQTKDQNLKIEFPGYCVKYY
ncbi:MAG: beta-galactosidase [Sedimentisphaeraceae bacterium JB056]